jgi:hypothetical protein
LAESIEFWQVGSGELGRSEQAEWQAALRIMQQMGLVGEVEGVDGMFTNQFIVTVEP